VPTPLDFFRQQALKAGSRALREVLSGARQLPEELVAPIGIVRNALSNVSELPVQAAEYFRLGPTTSRISREAYGGAGVTGRGGLTGTRNLTPVPPRAPVPAWTGKAAESAAGYPRPRPTPGGALVPTTPPSAPSTASRDLARDQLGRSLEARVGTVGPNVPPSAPSSVNPNYFPSSVNPNYVPSSVNPNYFPSSVNKNYFLDPEFRSIDPSSAFQLRLDLRAPRGAQAARPYKTTKGASRPEGTNVGGQFYRPDIMVEDNVVTVGPRGKGGNFRADVGTQDVIRGSLEAAQAVSPPNTNMVRTPAGQLEMVSPTGAVMFSGDVVGRTAAAFRSPGLKFVNLNAPTTLQRLLLGGLGVGSFAAGISAMRSEGERKRSEGQMPMTTEEENTPSADLIKQMQVQQAGMDMGRALAARLFTDESGRPLADSGNGGASQDRNRREATRSAVQQGGDPAAAMVARAIEPRDPSSYKSAADYFAAEREYAQQQGMRGLMRQAGEQLAQRMQTEAQLGAWAEANPHLMYRLQQQQLANPAMNQQTGMNYEGEDVNAAMGSDSGNNAAGFGESQTEVEMGNKQANDIAQATTPFVQPTLENLPTAIQQRLQEEALMRRSAGPF